MTTPGVVESLARPPSDRATAAPRSVVVARSVAKRFGDVYAVRDLTLDVPSGAICALVGPSGSGKTTAVRLMIGYHEPTGGQLRVMGVPPSQFSLRQRERIGYMPQHFALYPSLSVQENLDFFASLYGLSWFGRGRRIRKLLELVELWEHRHKKVDDVSGGMKRRLALAASLVHAPELLFLDEPTAGVDPILRAAFWEEFRRLAGEGRSLLVTTQYVTEAEYCDLVAVMDGGSVVAYGRPDELRHRALGGEELELDAPGILREDLDRLRTIAGVQEVERVGPDLYRIRVQEAATALPTVVESLRATSADVRSLRERRPNFDEVFVRIVEQVRDGGAS